MRTRLALLLMRWSMALLGFRVLMLHTTRGEPKQVDGIIIGTEEYCDRVDRAWPENPPVPAAGAAAAGDR